METSSDWYRSEKGKKWFERASRHKRREEKKLSEIIERDETNVETVIDQIVKETSTSSEKKSERKEVRQTEKAISLLKRNDYFYLVNETLGLKVIGDARAAFMIYIAACSSRFADNMLPQHIFFFGPSGAGKTYSTQAPLMLIPEDNVVHMNGATNTALRYYQGNLSGKILELEEWVPTLSDFFVATLRQRLSGSAKPGLVPVREQNKWVTKEIGPPGIPVFIVGTTANKLDYELVNRGWILHPNTSYAQTKEILEQQAKNAILRVSEDVFEKNASLLQECYQQLNYYDVINPYASLISNFLIQNNIANNVTARRYIGKLLNLANTVALVHQYQRHHYEFAGRDVLIAELSDMYMASKAAEPFMIQSVYCLSRNAFAAYEIIKKESEPRTFEQLLQKAESDIDIKPLFHEISARALNEACQELMEKGLSSRTGNVYTLSGENPFTLENSVLDLSSIQSAVADARQRHGIETTPFSDFSKRAEDFVSSVKDPFTGKMVRLYLEKTSEETATVRADYNGAG